jgi:hypothetical protein
MYPDQKIKGEDKDPSMEYIEGNREIYYKEFKETVDKLNREIREIKRWVKAGLWCMLVIIFSPAFKALIQVLISLI